MGMSFPCLCCDCMGDVNDPKLQGCWGRVRASSPGIQTGRLLPGCFMLEGGVWLYPGSG